MNWNWIHPNYETPIAVAFLILGLLMPWSIAVQRPPVVPDFYTANWWFGQGLHVPGDRSGLVFATDVVAAQATTPRTLVYSFWVLTTIAFIAGCVITILAITPTKNVDQDVAVHRAAGMTLLLTGSSYTAITLWMLLYGTPGLYFPLGSALMMAFGALLVTNRTADLPRNGITG